MNKTEFLDGLKSRLSSLPQNELEERLCFYAEMIDDRIEDGLSEDDAVLSIGTVEDIAGEILAQSHSEKKDMRRRRIKTWQIVLLIAGSPIWGALLISAAAVVISLYASLWAVVVSVWAAFATCAAVSVFGTGVGVMNIFSGEALGGIAIIGMSLLCAGLAVFSFIGCKCLTRFSILILRNIVRCVKKCNTWKGEER